MAGDLKLGLNTGYWAGGPPEGVTDSIAEAEKLGYESMWTAEAYGSDGLTPLAWWGSSTERLRLGTAITQMSARQPAATAMAAMTMDHLSGGRFVLGLGVSGPQVVEGWYGMPFAKPLARTREYIEILRSIWARSGPVSLEGEHYRLPYDGPGATGLGKALKASIHPLRTDIPIFLGAEGPKNVALAAEIADGWLPIFYHVENGPKVYADALSVAKPGFEIACPVTVVIDDDTQKALDWVKLTMSFYIGGMGAKDKNFHLDVVSRFGFEEEAHKVQELSLSGDRDAAAKAVPDELCDGIALCGPIERIAERLELWRSSPVTTLILGGVTDPAQVKALADLVH